METVGVEPMRRHWRKTAQLQQNLNEALILLHFLVQKRVMFYIIIMTDLSIIEQLVSALLAQVSALKIGPRRGHV